MNPKNKILVDRVIDSIDWDLVLKIYKMLKRSVGVEPTKIPGIKKIVKGEKMSSELIKEEVLAIINYAIDNDLPELNYGPWSIIWVNGEWEIDISEESENDDVHEEDRIYVPINDSVLEILFSPIIAISQERVEPIRKNESPQDSQKDLNMRLEEAIKEENYELASKIKDLMDSYKKKN